MKKIFLIFIFALTTLSAQNKPVFLYQLEDVNHKALRLTQYRDSLEYFAEDIYKTNPLKYKCLRLNILIAPRYESIGHRVGCRKEEFETQQIVLKENERRSIL